MSEKLVTVAAAATHVIDRRVYGQFAEHLGRCVYEGLWVGPDSPIPHKNGIRTDAVAALRQIKVPLVRWPGGCFADEYHWLRGVGPERQPMVNTHWGGVIEPNTFGTHEYFELLDQLDAEAYINGNVGSGTVQEMTDWIEYMTLESTSPMAELRKAHGRVQPWRLDVFGVGNENWGCGGNMPPEHYAALYRQYQTYVRNYGDHRIHKVACGPNADDYTWTDVMMRSAGSYMDSLSLHYYTIPSGEWSAKGSATDFGEQEWYDTLARTRKMEELITRHAAIMDTYDPDKRVGLAVDEWGTWYDVEPGTNPGFLYQQNTIRDAVVAAINLNIFHRHADRVRMANIAQMVNVLQSMLLTDGPRLIRTPTYHVFDLYSAHQGAAYVPTTGDLGEHGDHTVSRSGDATTISLVNEGLTDEIAAVVELPAPISDVLSARVVAGATHTSHNTFDAPEVVVPVDVEPAVDGRRLRLTLPPRSVATVRLRTAS